MQKTIIPSFCELQKDKLVSAVLEIKKRTREEFLVIVADEEARVLLHNMLSIVDLAKIGVIHQVLKLEEKRQSIKYHVIYLISPGTDSIKLIVNDFKNGKKYAVFDILALGSLTNEDLALIKATPEVKDPLKGLNEIFLDFIPWFDNGFSFQTKTNFLKMHTTQWINLTAKKLCSILLSLQKFSTFQLVYPESLEPLAKKVKTQLQSSLEILKKYQFQSYSSTFPVTKILLFPRELDYQSPLMRSYDYLSLIYNLLFVSTFQSKIDKIQLNQKYLLWQTKYLNYPDAVEAISNISDKQNKNKQNQSDMNNNTHKFIHQAMKNEFMIDNIEAHLGVVEKLTRMSANYQDLTTLQQTVVNGIDESGLKKTDKQIWKLIDKQFDNMKQISEKPLLEFIALCCFSLDSTNQPVLKKIAQFSKNGQKLVQNISKFDCSPSKLKQKPLNQRFDLFRHQPKIVHYLRQFQFGSKTYSLQTKDVGAVQKLARTMPKYGQQSKLVLFSTGYLGINEFVALNRNNKNLIIGSNKIVSPWEYVADLLQIQTQ